MRVFSAAAESRARRRPLPSRSVARYSTAYAPRMRVCAFCRRVKASNWRVMAVDTSSTARRANDPNIVMTPWSSDQEDPLNPPSFTL